MKGHACMHSWIKRGACMGMHGYKNLRADKKDKLIAAVAEPRYHLVSSFVNSALNDGKISVVAALFTLTASF